MYIFKVKTNWCFKSGGGSSGKVDFPDYMKDAHADWLDDDGADTLNSSVVDLMNSALGSSPYSGESSYDPDADIAIMLSSLASFDTLVSVLDPSADWLSSINDAQSGIDNILTDTSLDAEIAANDAIVDDRLTNEILPRFQAGMRNINAVNSSIFIIGQSNLEGLAQRDKNKFAGSIRHRTYMQRNEFILRSSSDLNKLYNLRLEYEKIITTLTTDIYKIKILAKREELETQLEFEVKDGIWDLELLSYGNNVLAAISGASGGGGPAGPSKAQSTLGGALSGAAMGASAGGWVGALGGAVLGGYTGYSGAN